MLTTHDTRPPYGNGHITEMPALAPRDAKLVGYGALQAAAARAANSIQQALDALPAGAIEARTRLQLTLADLTRATAEAAAITAR